MDFARKQLEKYGWSEGKGLGKNETGISSALKPKLKFDNTGVGHNVGEEFSNNWWEKLFNSAAQNINVETTSKDIMMSIKDETAVEITTKSYSVASLKRNKNSLEYGTFVKTAKLTENGMQHYENVIEVENFKDLKPSPVLSDAELLAACGGRTAHKGARHGLKLSGKLSRIEKQEKMLLKKMKKISLTDDKQLIEKKLKKIKKNSDNNREEPNKTSSKRKSSRKHKTVTFSETTITKYYTTETDTSFDSELSSLRDENSNESGSLERESLQDEQSECDSINSEEQHCNINDLSKAERKRLKRLKRKQKNNSTELFLKSVSDCVSDSDLVNVDGNQDVNLKKRKFYSDDSEYSDSKRSQSETESPNRLKVKKNKKKKKRQRRLEAKKLSSIVKSLDNVCRISDNE